MQYYNNMETIQEKIKGAYDALKGTLGWSNVMETPKVEKIVVSTSFGRMRKEKDKLQLIQDRLQKITGQMPSPRKAKKSIASFKLREGENVGYAVTLRGKMRDTFLYKLIHVALPRTRDFRGIPRTSVDEMGNLTIGVREHTVFPEISSENAHDVFGLSITIVTNQQDRESATAFLEHIGIPFVRK